MLFYLKIIFFVIFFFQYITCQLDVISDDTPLAERGPCISNPCLHNGLCTITTSGFMCTCVDGYIGVMCEKRSDDCSLDDYLKCSSNGRCKLDVNGVPICMCNVGYTGTTCSQREDGCDKNPCLNGGRCVDENDSYTCMCPAAKEGSRCQIDKESLQKCVSHCEGNTFNGGNCWQEKGKNISVTWGYGDFICNSKQSCFGFPPPGGGDKKNKEEYMEVQLKPISMQQNDHLLFLTTSENDLQNGEFIPRILPIETSSPSDFLLCNVSGAHPITTLSDTSSEVTVNSSYLTLGTQYFLADINALYRCVFGLRLNVTVKTKYCNKNEDDGPLCNGRGRCYSDFNQRSYQCLCCHGYTGQYCQYEDPCLLQPCANNGSCSIIDYGDGMLKHHCACARGFHGDSCENVIDYCLNHSCQNDAICYTKQDGYACKCTSGFSGIYCEIDNGKGCSNSTCKNGGKCIIATGDSFFCECLDGFKGTVCEIELNECESDPCVQGICIDHINNYTCVCEAGREGRNCQHISTECNTRQCSNNGVCVRQTSGEDICDCGIAYTGLSCEIELDLCDHSKFCELSNAISCSYTSHNVTCVCQDGWSGSNCGINVDECTGHECLNSGDCIDETNGYQCRCPIGYTGTFCENREIMEFPDIEIEFGEANCHSFTGTSGIRSIKDGLIDLLQQTCKCNLPLSRAENSWIACKKQSHGILMTDLSFNDLNELKHVVCGLMARLQSSGKIDISGNVYITSVHDHKELCPTTKSEVLRESSTTGVIAGAVLGLLIIMISFIMISIKIRNIRRKIGVTHKEMFSIGNTGLRKDTILNDTSVDETSFSSCDTIEPTTWSNRKHRSIRSEE